MIYIFCATKSEAQAIVEYKKLKKEKISPYTLFRSSDITLVITGIGMEKARNAALFCKERCNLREKDTVLNIGIAAAPACVPVGTLCEVKTLFRGEKRLDLDTATNRGYTLVTTNSAQNTPHEHLVDMEGFAIAEVFGKNLKIYKVVSDHFEPTEVTKEKAKKLIASVLAQVEEI